jgi:spore coat protein H
MGVTTGRWGVLSAGLLASGALPACGGAGDRSQLEAPLELTNDGANAGTAPASVAGSGPGSASGGAPEQPSSSAGEATIGGGGTVEAGEPSPAAGAGGTPPSSTTPDASATPDRVPGDALFADGQVLEVRLTLLAADLLELDEHGDREEYMPAQAELASTGGAAVQMPEIGVRHKGNWTLHHCWDDFEGVRSYEADCAKLSLKLKFDEYVADTRFDGLKRLNLHASTGDGSRLRELLAYATFRAFGVDAPRAIPARVYVNDEPRGLFIAVEDVDGRYTTAHFPDAPDGNLYKEIWPRASFEDEEFALALETNEELGDVSGMRAFAEAVARSTPETFAAEVEPLLDVDGLARYLAVDRALRNWDGITSFYEPRRPHNFYWYEAGSGSPRFHLIPWDMDDTYWPFDPYTNPEPPVTAPPIPNLNVRPAHCEPRPIWSADGSGGYVTPGRCDALLDGFVTRHWSRIVERGRELLEGPFAPAAQSARVEAWAATLAPIVAEDPVLDPAAWEGAVTDLHDVLERSASGFHGFLEEGLLDEPPGDGSAEGTSAEDTDADGAAADGATDETSPEDAAEDD